MTDSNFSKQQIAEKTKQSLIWYTTVPFIIHFVRFANSILLARLLSPSDFGIIGIVSVILYYCDSFSDFGFGKAIVQRRDISGQHYASYFSFNIMISMLFVAGGQLFAPSLAGFYEIPELEAAVRVYSLLFLITAFSSVAKIKLRRELSFKSLAIIEGIKVAIAMSISLTLAMKGFAFWAIIYAMLVSNSVAMVLLFVASGLVPRLSANLKPLRELLNFGAWDFIGAQFRLVGDSADKLIIGKVLGADFLGYYDKAFGLARMPNDQVSIRLSHISFSSFSRIQDDRTELEQSFFKIVILNATIVLPILVGLIWVSESFTAVLLGDKWLPIVPSMKILAASFIMVSLTNPIVAMNQAMAQVKHQTIIRIVLTVLLVFALLQVAPFGIQYAALAFLVFNALMFAASYALLKSHLGFGWSSLIISLLPPFFIVTCMSVALFAIHQFSGLGHGIAYLMAAIMTGGAVYALLFLMLPFSRLAFLRNRALTKIKFFLIRRPH